MRETIYKYKRNGHSFCGKLARKCRRVLTKIVFEIKLIACSRFIHNFAGGHIDDIKGVSIEK